MASGASVSVTGCVPLAGRGVIARYGALVGATASRGLRPDPLLRTLAAVAASAGDGVDLVRGVAGAALSGRPGATWACAGVTTGGGVAVLVHGRAVAAVRVDADPEVTLRAVDSATPVSREFAGATVTLCLLVGQAAAPEPQFWLGDGVACGGGLMVTVTADASQRVSAHPPTADAPLVRTPTSGPPPEAAPDMTVADDHQRPVLVDGALCASGHFNDPAARTCRQCGTGLYQPPRSIQRRPRPPLGVLVLDDGTRFPLDCDYVIGREPAFDSDVIERRSRPLRISDPNGTVSRLHLRISLVGWRVEVSDLGSANGSVLQSSEGERKLVPYEPTAIEPGARIGIGHRIMQYLA